MIGAEVVKIQKSGAPSKEVKELPQNTEKQQNDPGEYLILHNIFQAKSFII